MIIRTTTNIWPVVSVGMYDGQPLNIDEVFDSYDLDFDIEDKNSVRINKSRFNREAWDKAVVKAVNVVFKHSIPLENHGVQKVTAVNVWHPSEYNFYTDELDLDVEVEDVDRFVKEAVDFLKDDKYKERMEEYIRKHWKSRDGFTSFMPCETYDQFFECAEAYLDSDAERIDVERFLGGVLCLLSVCDDELALDLWEPGECLDTATYTDDVREYIQDHYNVSEFFHSYNPHQVLADFGLAMPKFKEAREGLEASTDKYCEAFGEETLQAKKARMYCLRAKARINDLQDDLLDVLDCQVGYYWGGATPPRIKDKLDEINKELADGLHIKYE